MRLALLLPFALLAADEGKAQIPDLSAMPHQLRTMTAAELGPFLFGAKSPPFTDVFVEGPTARDKAIRINLATTPVSTGYDGLCAVTVGKAAFIWRVGARGEDLPVHLGGSPGIKSGFFLPFDNPTLGTSTTDRHCAAQTPFSSPGLSSPGLSSTIFYVAYWPDGRHGELKSNAAAARFGIKALMLARQAASGMRVGSEGCVSGLADSPAACGDPTGFVRAFYLRDLLWLMIERCENARTLCVNATFRGLRGEGLQAHVIVETGETAIDRVESPTVRAITIGGPDYDLLRLLRE